ncbi:GTPase-activating protein, putative [Plasmodium berghei]|uniref:GTPase-activating protein, putative n=1 Tax=Plasmodium berghei TaxID=5821 RepID=A0A113SNN2_PLABE|nr:GTPase-activating protein, putative [Plasmodium berghei]SCM18484.1 GTPase-activating protein, putative [Plasmodium berghei]
MKETNNDVKDFVSEIRKIETWKYIDEEAKTLFYLKKIIQEEIIMLKFTNNKKSCLMKENKNERLKTDKKILKPKDSNINKSKLSSFLNSTISYDNYFNLNKPCEKNTATMIKNDKFEKIQINNHLINGGIEQNVHNKYNNNKVKNNLINIENFNNFEIVDDSLKKEYAPIIMKLNNYKISHYQNPKTTERKNSNYSELNNYYINEKLTHSQRRDEPMKSNEENYFDIFKREVCNCDENDIYIYKNSPDKNEISSSMKNKICFNFDNVSRNDCDYKKRENENMSCYSTSIGNIMNNGTKKSIKIKRDKINDNMIGNIDSDCNNEENYIFKNEKKNIYYKYIQKKKNALDKKDHIKNSQNENNIYSNNSKNDEDLSSNICRISLINNHMSTYISSDLILKKKTFMGMSLSQKKKYFAEHSKKINSMIKNEIIKGIPDYLRGFVWQILLQSYTYKDRTYVKKDINNNENHPDHINQSNECEKGYKYYLSINNKYENSIKKDINRTYPKHILFKNNYEKGQKILFNVLKAYSNYNQDLGYCQGMAFIVATFILYMNEEDSFYMLIALLDKYKLNDLFSSSMPLLNEYLYILDKLLLHFFPKIYNHLEKENIHSSMYASQWFITLFSYNINILYAVRIWDFFFIHNYTFLFKVALAFFKLQEEEILKESFESILNRLKVLSKHVELDVLLKTALDIKIKNGLISKIISEYKSQK